MKECYHSKQECCRENPQGKIYQVQVTKEMVQKNVMLFSNLQWQISNLLAQINTIT